MGFPKRSIFTVFICLVFLGALISALHWPLRASVMVFVLGGGVALPIVILQLYLELKAGNTGLGNASSGMDVPLFQEGERTRDIKTWCWLFGLLFGTWFIGFRLALPLFAFVFSKLHGARWYVSLLLGALAFVLLYSLFDMVINVSWPKPFLFTFLGE